jgi:flavin-dependent dehydrogenase
MKSSADVIIVGGGPAGSSCAWSLKRQGVDCLVLDKEPFPRGKPCAGWITPEVVEDLLNEISSKSFDAKRLMLSWLFRRPYSAS